MRNRAFVLCLALLCLLTAQCLLACSTAQQAAHACCPHTGNTDRTIDASVPVDPVSVEPGVAVAVFGTESGEGLAIAAYCFTPSVQLAPQSPPNRIIVLRV